MTEQHSDKLAELEERYTGYEVYDRDGEKIGKVDDLFVDENDDLEYIGVKTGLLGRRSILIPMDAARVDEGRRIVEVSQPKSEVKEGPTFDDEKEITPEFEQQVRNYYGLGSPRGSMEQDVAEGGTYAERAEGSEEQPGAVTGDFDEERGELQEHPDSAEHEGVTSTEAERSFAGYQVYDRHYERIGKVDDLFLDENDQPEYIGVKMGFLGARSSLIPMDIVRVNDRRRLVEIEADKDAIQEGPTFGDEREITSEFERRVLTYYRLEIAQVSSERGPYGPYYSDTTGDEQVDVLPGERAGTHEHLGEPGEAATDTDRERTGGLAAGEDELRAPRSEDEGEANPPERQAESVNVRKRVRTDRQRSEVPKSREEVRADHPAVEGRETSESDIGDDATKTSG